MFLLARRWFGAVAGWISAVLMATYWVFIYYEGELLEPVLLVTIGLCLLYALGEYAASSRRRFLVFSGVFLGLYALVRPNILIFGAALPFWIWWLHWRRTGKPYPPFAAWLIYGGLVLITVLPATIRNVRVSGDWVLISSNGGINLLFGQDSDGVVGHASSITGPWNCFDYDAIVNRLSHEIQTPLTHAQASRRFTQEAVQMALDNPGRSLRLALFKTLLFWGPQEVCNQDAFGTFHHASRVLRWTPVGFPFLLGFALLGILILIPVRGLKRAGTCRGPVCDMSVLLVLFIVTYFLSYLPFIAGGAYRIPLIPVLMLLAAYALAETGGWFRAGRKKTALAWLTAGCCLWVAASVNYTQFQPGVAHIYLAEAISHERNGDLPAAETAYKEALRSHPDFAVVHNRLGALLMQLNRPQEASGHFQKAVELESDNVDFLFNRGLNLALLDQYNESSEYFERVLVIQPDHLDASFNLGVAYFLQNKMDEAAAQLQHVLSLEPHHTNAAIYLQKVRSMEPPPAP